MLLQHLQEVIGDEVGDIGLGVVSSTSTARRHHKILLQMTAPSILGAHGCPCEQLLVHVDLLEWVQSNTRLFKSLILLMKLLLTQRASHLVLLKSLRICLLLLLLYCFICGSGGRGVPNLLPFIPHLLSILSDHSQIRLVLPGILRRIFHLLFSGILFIKLIHF